MFRGLALVIIFVDHIPFDRFARLTLRNFGFTTAADIFVLLAGVSFVLAHSARLDRGAYGAFASNVAKRMALVYAAHLVVMALGLLLLFLAHRPVPLDQYVPTPDATWGGLLVTEFLGPALQLSYQPPYFDILPLYVVLLAFAVPLLLLARVHWALAMSASFAIWAWAEILGVNFHSTRSPEGWYFDPFTWQVVFSMGLCIGLANRSGLQIPRSPWLAIACAVFLAIVAAITRSCIHSHFGSEFCMQTIPGANPLSDNQSLWRMLNTLAWTYLVVRFVPRDARWLSNNPLAGAMACMGRNSLLVFCAGALLSLAARIFLADKQFDLFTQFALNLFGISIMTLVAYLGELSRDLKRPIEPASAKQPEEC